MVRRLMGEELHNRNGVLDHFRGRPRLALGFVYDCVSLCKVVTDNEAGVGEIGQHMVDRVGGDPGGGVVRKERRADMARPIEQAPLAIGERPQAGEE
jgi:hypothetical protein